jgi:hypothetical protein
MLFTACSHAAVALVCQTAIKRLFLHDPIVKDREKNNVKEKEALALQLRMA